MQRRNGVPDIWPVLRRIGVRKVAAGEWAKGRQPSPFGHSVARKRDEGSILHAKKTAGGDHPSSHPVDEPLEFGSGWFGAVEIDSDNLGLEDIIDRIVE